jgi:hypothetical protein
MTDEQQQQARLEAVEQLNQGIIYAFRLMRNHLAWIVQTGGYLPHHFRGKTRNEVMQALDDYCVEQIIQAKSNLPKPHDPA